MGHCTIDHSQQDVIQKLESQRTFLPSSLYEEAKRFTEAPQTQETLNELFHLLKKYDLASLEEQKDRNEKLKKLMG
ncbi:hypothetical protein [Bacillus thermotolerans]|uniref:Group-specific protein n=1 Tax=Bacillus thermotolerans TaxID=1221996 RepID=A0A0F5HVW8_BACTR|nr:hypothetical protein [Bacillus thermotolerans]KKB37388.1 hypothetical protein QY97_00243 [Bacillus thermotolerans]KKB39626.1 hypothetical protein QY95_02256 [Bacillus thermotolerans]KKB44477.1 hypothetical protein QY96_02605 [Bacillus thermotolerans]